MKKLICLFALAMLAGCYNPKTHGSFISEHQDAWVDGYAIRISEHKVADKGLLYCRANVEKDGSAKPTCFGAKFKE